MLTLISIVLAVAALYSGVTWLAIFVKIMRPGASAAIKADPDLRAEIQASTFHLGLCCIIAAGFLGLILKTGS